MRIQLRGRRWTLVRHNRLRLLDGFCEYDQTHKRLVVKAELQNRVELETFIHEMSHACFLDLREDVINQQSRDISRTLWAIGYRRNSTTNVMERDRTELRRFLRLLLQTSYPYLRPDAVIQAATDMAVVLMAVGYSRTKQGSMHARKTG